ncbi:MAG: indole-3-glycerol phosphate synthase TrpC [Chlamydiia bacterium]|nr:indole-3-glycerol phosphate synthase TrpC [Chlamydiia bacterium]
MNYLDEILQRKQEEVDTLREQVGSDPYHPLHHGVKGKGDHAFYRALKEKKHAVIGEIKRKSPSKGEIDLSLDPVTLAKAYEAGGARALSVLTDEVGFGGSLKDLMAVREAVSIPILRKDFIIDTVQISEAIHAGADAVLLIVRALGEQLEEFLEFCNEQGIDALVEVYDEAELHIALEAKTQIIGINHRNLETFEVDITHSKSLIKRIPETVVKVAESGIHRAEDAHTLLGYGFDALLIGEALVRSGDPKKLIGEICDVD